MLRIKFAYGLQTVFLKKLKNATGKTWSNLALMAGITNRTFLDWRNGTSTISKTALDKFIHLAHGKIKIPQHKILPSFWQRKCHRCNHFQY